MTELSREEVLRMERDHAFANYERAVKILAGIHAMLHPPKFNDGKGQTFVFRSPMLDEQVQALSDRIRAIPDEIEYFHSQLAAERAVSDRLLEALKELVELKAMRDNERETGTPAIGYSTRKPEAWKAARTAIAEVEAMRAQQAAMRKEKLE